VGAADEVDVVLDSELSNHLLAKSETHTSIVVVVLLDSPLWVRPKEVAKQTRVRDICGPHNVSYLVKGLEFGRESAMHAQNLVVNKRTNGKAIEHITKDLPEFDRVPPFTLIVESVYAVDLGALVVATQKEEVLRVLYLVTKEQRNRLN